MFNFLFKKTDDIAEESEFLDFHSKMNKLALFLCRMGIHLDIFDINDDGEIHCLVCDKKVKDPVYNIFANNFIIDFIANRYFEVKIIHHELMDPYADY